MSDELKIKIDMGYRGLLQGVSFSETKEQYDPVPIVRLYCTMHNSAYALQIRGRVPLSAHGGRKHERNLIATANLSWADLVQIADYVAAIKKQMIEGHYDDERCEPEKKDLQDFTEDRAPGPWGD